jgi:hypothetical protein
MGGPGHVYPLVQKNSTACSRDGLRKEKKKLVLVEADAGKKTDGFGRG